MFFAPERTSNILSGRENTIGILPWAGEKNSCFFYAQMVRWESLPQPPRLFSQPRLGITSGSYRCEGSFSIPPACHAREPLMRAAHLPRERRFDAPTGC